MNDDNIITATALGHRDGLVTAELDQSLDWLRCAAHDDAWESAIGSAPLVTVVAVVFHHSPDPDIDLDPELDPDDPCYQREDEGFYLDPDQAVKLAHRLLELAALAEDQR